MGDGLQGHQISKFQPVHHELVEICFVYDQHNMLLMMEHCSLHQYFLRFFCTGVTGIEIGMGYSPYGGQRQITVVGIHFDV